MRELGKWTNAVSRSERPRLKTPKKRSSSWRMFSLSFKGRVSDLGESAAVRCAQTSLLDFGDDVKESDKDPAVVKDAETFSVTGSDTTKVRQEKDARTVGRIPSR